MKKKIALLSILFGTTALACAVTANVLSPRKSRLGKADGPEFTLTLGSSDTPSEVTGSYQNSVSGTVKTSLENDVDLTFVNAKKVDGKFVQLANHGRIYNYHSSNANKLTGINGVSFTGEGSFVFKPAVAKGLLADVAPISVSAGGAKVAVPTCDYFEIEAGDSGAVIENLEFSYSCDANAYDVKLLNGTYTGIGTDSNTWKVVINNGAVTVSSLDKASNMSLTGTATMSSKTAVQIAFNEYDITVNYTYNGHSLAYATKSGAQSAYYPDVSGDRVYTLENFESYSASGQGYTSSSAKYTTTGLRSQFYADYYTGSNTSEIGGSGWQLMTSTDNTNYNSSKGHNGSKVGIFKLSNGTGMRYISMNELYGVQRLAGKGQTLSFWARGAYTNASFNTDHASGTSLSFYLYYATPLTPSNQSTVRESFTADVAAGSTWQHFEFPLTAGRNYLGFGFYAKQSSGSNQYLPIDDIQIYSASPYAEYVAPVAVTGVSVSPNNLDLLIGGSSVLTATVSPNDATNKTVSWTSSNTNVATVDNDGTVHAVATGSATITATTADGGYTSTCAVTVTAPLTHYPEGTFMAVVSNYKLVIAIGNETNGLVAVRISTADAEATAITYNSGNDTFTITTTGSVGGYTVGNVTGTYDYNNDRLTNVNCSGQIGAAVSNVTLTRPTSGMFYDMNESTANLQSKFKRRFNSGSWQVDSSNSDRIVSNTEHHVAGSSGLQVRPCGTGFDAYGFSLQNDLASTATVANIHFWVYNPCNYDITFRVWVYKSTGLSNNAEVGLGSADKAKANSWTYVSRGFTSAAIYNFNISVWKNNNNTSASDQMTAKLVFDDLYFY